MQERSLGIHYIPFPPSYTHTHTYTHTHSEDGEEEEDLVGSAEEEFWANLAQEQKEIESKEQKRREALLPKDKPTPIPEEGAEISAEETKVGLALPRAANVSCYACLSLLLFFCLFVCLFVCFCFLLLFFSLYIFYFCLCRNQVKPVVPLREEAPNVIFILESA